MKLRLRNDTPFSASVSVLAERSIDARNPLKQNIAGSLPVIAIEPGASVLVCFHENGFELAARRVDQADTQ